MILSNRLFTSFWNPLGATFEQFDTCLQIPKDRCFFWVWSCRKPTLYIFLKSLMSRFLYDFQAFWAVLIYAFKFRKIDVFFEFGVVGNRLFTSFWNLSEAAFYMTFRHFWAVLIHASQFRKMDGFTEFGVVQNRLFTSLRNLSGAACYMTCSHFEHVLIHASNSER